MYEVLKAIEVEDESGETQVLTIKRLITQEPGNERATFSNELLFRPGGGAIARRVDNRVQTLADDAIADAHHRQREETDRLRQQGMTQARGGGEHSMEPSAAPGKRPPRGSRRVEEPATPAS